MADRTVQRRETLGAAPPRSLLLVTLYALSPLIGKRRASGATLAALIGLGVGAGPFSRVHELGIVSEKFN